MRRTTIWMMIGVLVVIGASLTIAVQYFYFDLCPFMSCDETSRHFQAGFEWDSKIKSIGPVRSVGGLAEPDRRWRRLVRSTMIQGLPQVMRDQRIVKAKGNLTLQFHGYGVVLQEALSISDPDFDAFWKASWKGDAATVEGMLDRGMDRNVDVCTRLEKTSSINGAAEGGHSDVVRILAAHSANINAVDQHGSTPLMLAAVEGHEETVRVLISVGANVNAVDSFGSTALSYAARTRHTAIVKHLLASGAFPNSQDEFGRSALMYAAEDGPVDVLEALLAAGADVKARDKDGNTAHDIATRKGHAKIAQMLSIAAGTP